MKKKKPKKPCRLPTYLLCGLVAVLPGCSVFSPEQKASLRQTIQSEYDAGNMTAAQRDAALEALEQDQPIDWETLGIVGLNAALALIGGPMIVRKVRGPATQRVGLPQSMVKS